MEIFRFNILPDEEFSKRELFKHSLMNCQVCGGDLKFEHNKEASTMNEAAQCPCCKISLKAQTHTLQ